MADKVHHATRRAADRDLAEGAITEQSHAAVIAGEMDLATARNIGADVGPTDTSRGAVGQPERQEAPREAQDAPTGPRLASRISKDDHLSPCLCGECGKLVKGRFAAGHDMRMFRIAREHLEEGRELTKEQREYLEESGKMERVKARIAEEERKRQEKERRKAERKEKK